MSPALRSRSGDRPGSAGAHLTRAWRRRCLLALGAFALVLVLVRLAGSPPPSESWEPIVGPTALDRHPPLREDPGDCAGAPTGVLIVAWDGADWAHVLPLIDAGRMPNLAALMERGARGNLYGLRPSLSPA